MPATKLNPTRAKCECVKKINEQLKPENCYIVTEMLFGRRDSKVSVSPPSLRMAKIESAKRGTTPVLFCTHCPFCGKKYPK